MRRKVQSSPVRSSDPGPLIMDAGMGLGARWVESLGKTAVGGRAIMHPGRTSNARFTRLDAFNFIWILVAFARPRTLTYASSNRSVSHHRKTN